MAQAVDKVIKSAEVTKYNPILLQQEVNLKPASRSKLVSESKVKSIKIPYNGLWKFNWHKGLMSVR
jgi:hypothetical protein